MVTETNELGSTPETTHRDEQDDSEQEYWLSSWLRTTTLVSFAALFAVLAASLIVLWLANRNQDVFRPTLTQNHYAWTYGPTAILVIIVSLWRQVDYYCKILQPWQELRRGPAAAADSVLLDYIGPMNATSFIKALRLRHWPVVCSIGGFLLLKLMALLSTGLLILAPTTTNRSTPITFTTSFDTSKFWKTAWNDLPSWLPALDSSPVYQYLGMLNGDNQAPQGTQDNLAFQSFTVSMDEPFQNITAEVQVFSPGYACEIADISFDQYENGVYTRNASLTTPSCSSERLNLDSMPWCTEHGTLCMQTRTRIENYLFEFNCTADQHLSYVGQRIALVVSNVTYIPVASDSDQYTAPKFDMSFGKTAAVICHMDYSLNEATSSTDSRFEAFKIGALSGRRQLDNLTGNVVQEFILGTLQAARDDVPNPSVGGPGPNPRSWITSLPNDPDGVFHVDFGPPQQDRSLLTYWTKPVWYLLLRTLPVQQHTQMEQFLSPETLNRSASRVFNGLAVQVVRKHFLLPSKTFSNGTAVVSEERLQIGVISLWIMVVISLFLVACALCIIWKAPRSVIRHHPSSIATSALVLAASPEMKNLLVSNGSSRTSQLTATLTGRRCVTLSNGSIGLDFTGPSSTVMRNKGKPWIPLPARYYMACITFCTPLTAIIILEVVYALSERMHGIVDVTGIEGSATYLSRYLSALIMFLIATNFNSLDFAISAFAPYSLLRTGSVSAARGIDFHILGSFPPVALYKSMRRKHWASALSTFTGIPGGVLTIISSGLWSVDWNVIESRAIQVPLAHSWNVTWHNSSTTGDGGAGVTLNTIQHGGATMGPLLWNDHVLPELGAVSSISGDLSGSLAGSSSLNYTFALGSLRPHLECKAISDEHVNLYYGAVYEKHVDVLFPLEGRCQRGGRYGTNAFYNASWEIPVKADATRIGRICDLHLGPFDDQTLRLQNRRYNITTSMEVEYAVSSLELGEVSYAPDNIMGCPSIGIVFGDLNPVFTGEDLPILTGNITTLLCSQQVEEVELTVTYHGNQTKTPTIVGTDAPRQIPGESYFVTDETGAFDAFPYRVQTYIGYYDWAEEVNRGMNPGGNLSVIDPANKQPYSPVDSFMENIINGPDGVAFEELIGKTNQDALIKAVQKLYNKYMSLVIDAKFRQQPSDSSKAPMADGELKVLRSRLVVSFTSKLALQVLLAVMTVTGGIAFWLADLQGTLPRKPTSIASTMAFLAGSELCDGPTPIIPKNALEKNSKEVAKMFDGWLFSLGWWPTATTTESEELDVSTNATTEKIRRFGIDAGVPEQLGFRKRRKMFSR